MKIALKDIINILLPVILGAIVGFITNSFGNYSDIIKPTFSPPGVVFPIIWSILYLLMGISKYIVSNDSYNERASKIYYLQLIVNLLWSFFFFVFKFYLFSFFWITLLIVLVIKMIKEFYKISRVSAYIQIPYLVWIIFAAMLNIAIYILN